MHPERLSILSYRHAPKVAVAKSVEATAETQWLNVYTLTCGHEFKTPPHFAIDLAEKPCAACGVAVVRSHPAYATEF